MMIHKDKIMVKTYGHASWWTNLMIKIQLKSPMLVSQQIKPKRYYKTLGTSVINSPMSPHPHVDIALCAFSRTNTHLYRPYMFTDTIFHCFFHKLTSFTVYFYPYCVLFTFDLACTDSNTLKWHFSTDTQSKMSVENNKLLNNPLILNRC